MHHDRYPTVSHRVYLNIYRGEEKAQLKGSICGDCLADLVGSWLSWALQQSAEGWVFPDGALETPDVPWMASGETVRPLRGSTRW
jgi:hypothetical protein